MKKILLLLSLFIGIVLLSAAFLFKIMHWPYVGELVIGGFLLIVTPAVLHFLRMRKHHPEERYQIIASIFGIAVCGFLMLLVPAILYDLFDVKFIGAIFLLVLPAYLLFQFIAISKYNSYKAHRIVLLVSAIFLLMFSVPLAYRFFIADPFAESFNHITEEMARMKEMHIVEVDSLFLATDTTSIDRTNIVAVQSAYIKVNESIDSLNLKLSVYSRDTPIQGDLFASLYPDIDELKSDMEHLRSELLVDVSDSTRRKEIETMLDTSDEINKGDWHSSNFEYLPVIAVQTILEQFSVASERAVLVYFDEL